MLKRLIFTLTVVVAIIAALAFVKYRQVTAAIAQYAAFQPPPEAVTTVEAREEPWPARLSAIGTVAAVRGVTVGADLPGVVDRIAFEAGHSVREATSSRSSTRVRSVPSLPPQRLNGISRA